MIHTLADVMPLAISENIPGLMLSIFEDRWAILLPGLTVAARYSMLKLNGRWSDGPWEDDLVLTSKRTAGYIANELGAVPANFADVIRHGRPDAEPVDPSSVDWWSWTVPFAGAWSI